MVAAKRVIGWRRSWGELVAGDGGEVRSRRKSFISEACLLSYASQSLGCFKLKNLDSAVAIPIIHGLEMHKVQLAPNPAYLLKAPS